MKEAPPTFCSFLEGRNDESYREGEMFDPLDADGAGEGHVVGHDLVVAGLVFAA